MGSIAELDTAIQQNLQAINNTPEDHPDRPERLHSLGLSYGKRYLRTDAIADINTAIQHFQAALNHTSAHHPCWSNRLHSLAIGYHNRYLRVGVITDLDTAIQHFETLLGRMSEDDNNRADRLYHLGVGYGERYLRKGTIMDLDMAIQHFQEALEKTPEEHPYHARQLQALGTGYHNRYQRTGAMVDLNLAVQQFQAALDQTPEDHPDRAGRLHVLGKGYREKHLKSKEMSDLDKAIQLIQAALDKTSEEHPDYADYLHILGIGYHDRYMRTGSMDDLDMGIQQYQKALIKTPENHPSQIGRLHHLGNSYRDRYRRLGARADLETSIIQIQKALEKTPEDHPDRIGQLRDLSVTYMERYQQTKSIKDLEISITQSQTVLRKTPEDHPHYIDRLHGLGAGYGERHRSKGAIEDINIAIQHFQVAIDKAPENYQYHTDLLQALGAGYHKRYLASGTSGAPTDLDMAIQQFETVLDKTPQNYPNRASRSYILGTGYTDRYRRMGIGSDLEMAIKSFQESLNHSLSPPTYRLKSGMILIMLLAEAKRWASAYEAASTAVALVPLLTPRSLANSDKQHLLIETAGLASKAAAVALTVGRAPFEAMQLLEIGRGVIIGSLIDLRIDMTDLRQVHPQLAEEYLNLRNKLDAATDSTSQSTQFNMPVKFISPVDKRYDAGQKLEKTIQAIRDLPGFNRFLLGPSQNELEGASAWGPIVVINVSNYRCDALIIQERQLRTLELPLLRMNDIKARAGFLENLTLLDSRLLEWMWDTIAEPVLDALGFTQPAQSPWPHMWWILTGPLAKFPIHAAGYHLRSPSDTVLDRVVSSYSCSIKALIQSRLHTKTVHRPEKASLVGMSELQYGPEEIAKLEIICNCMQLQVRKPRAYRSDVLAALDDCDIFHFAGHGRTDLFDPSKSALMLSDGALTVASFFESNLHKRRPFFAYLSACGTGQIKHDALVDEGIHLIAACQLAGFRHVIGTLWEVNDKFCVDVAIMTYERMQKQGMNDESISDGLHHASRSLRRRWVSENAERTIQHGSRGSTEDSRLTRGTSNSSEGKTRDPRDILSCDDVPLYWVPYVHFGV